MFHLTLKTLMADCKCYTVIHMVIHKMSFDMHHTSIYIYIYQFNTHITYQWMVKYIYILWRQGYNISIYVGKNVLLHLNNRLELHAVTYFVTFSFCVVGSTIACPSTNHSLGSTAYPTFSYQNVNVAYKTKTWRSDTNASMALCKTRSIQSLIDEHACKPAQYKNIGTSEQHQCSLHCVHSRECKATFFMFGIQSACSNHSHAFAKASCGSYIPVLRISMYQMGSHKWWLWCLLGLWMGQSQGICRASVCRQ